MKKSKTLIAGIIIAFLAVYSNQLQAQNTDPIRHGFTIGGSAGIGVLHFSKGMESNETSAGISLPNMKIGWFAKENLAVYLNSTGQIYEIDGVDRSFEGYIPSVQYWTSDKWWVSGGFGVALDTKAFYASEKRSTKTEWGKGVLLSSGYEFKQHEKWALDIQARLYMASVSRDEMPNLEGTNFTIAVGITLF
ncbi:MAG: hypothetical protein NXI20_25100 [bacterium]|nr:hypothetical protein [bacterium]